MKKQMLSAFFIVVVLFLSQPPLSAQPDWKSKGVGLRFSIWNMGNNDNVIRYVRDHGREYVETGGFGGWLYFYSRTSDRWMFEFNLGAFGKAEGEFNIDDDYDAVAVIPILLGLQREFITIENSSALRPYLAFGGGMYWITHAEEMSRTDREEVISTFKPGGYFGGGMNFFLTSNFALNFDLKYHLVDMQTGHELSGLEFGLGFSISWGSIR